MTYPIKGEAPTAATVEASSEKTQSSNQGIHMSHSTATPSIFDFHGNPVRIIDHDGEPWFVASDVCAALEYSNPSKAVADHLDDDEKMTLTTGYGHSGKAGGQRLQIIINESGLYALVLRSRKPEARKFAKWVTNEVLPSIRKTGEYGNVDPARLENAFAMAAEVSAVAARTVFQAIMEGREDWMFDRWMFTMNYGSPKNGEPHKPFAKRMDSNAIMVSFNRYAEMLTEPNGVLVSKADLANMARACIQRLEGVGQMKVSDMQNLAAAASTKRQQSESIVAAGRAGLLV